MVADSLRAGMMTETSVPSASGASERLGRLLAKRNRLANGTSQRRAGRRSVVATTVSAVLLLLRLAHQGIELLLQNFQLPLDLSAVVLGAGGGHAILGEQRRDQRVGVAHDRHR